MNFTTNPNIAKGDETMLASSREVNKQWMSRNAFCDSPVKVSRIFFFLKVISKECNKHDPKKNIEKILLNRQKENKNV